MQDQQDAATSEPAGHQDTPSTPGPDPVVLAWEKVLAEWDDAEAHRKFIALCTSLGRLSDAGQCYRVVRGADDKRSGEAKERIGQVLTAAMQQMRIERGLAVSPGRRWLTLLASAAALGMLCFALWSMSTISAN